jgi:dolichol-phosphate mannosyltransferase
MVTVVLPTYNEADNIREVVRALLALEVPELHVLIVDDDSPDGTGTIADQLQSDHAGRVHVLHRTGERGLGRAYIAGFRQALDMGSAFVVQMDADFSHSPAYVPTLLCQMDTWDVAVGSRYVSGGGLDKQWSWGRRLLSWWANTAYSRVILGLRVKDATAGFKCWKREVLETIDLSSIQSGGYVFQVEMAYLCEKLGFRVLEVPIYFADRRVGQSKMALPVKWEAAWRVWEIRWRYRRARPSRRRSEQDTEGERC